QKSTRTGLSLLTTSSSQFAAVNSTTLALGMCCRLSCEKSLNPPPPGGRILVCFHYTLGPSVATTRGAARGAGKDGLAGAAGWGGEHLAHLNHRASHEALIAALVVFSVKEPPRLPLRRGTMRVCGC